MKIQFPSGLLFGLLAVTLAVCQPVHGQSAPVSSSLSTGPVDDDTFVTFFYLPSYSYLHPALIFHAAKSGSTLLNTAPFTDLGGRTAYVSIEEMRDLIGLLAHSDLSWRKTKQTELPKPGLANTTDKLEIRIINPDGTALSLSNPDKLCETLAPLDAALKQPRALWEFQLFRQEYGCKVPGLNRNAYPQHDVGNE
jgi:hypothetical protein